MPYHPLLKECYRLPETELDRFEGTALLWTAQAWIVRNLNRGQGIQLRNHYFQRLEEYERGWKWVGSRQVRCDRLSDEDLRVMRDLPAWFRHQPTIRIVELGFNNKWKKVKVAFTVTLPSGNCLFLAVGSDRGLKTFYVRSDFKEKKTYQCTVPGCRYVKLEEIKSV